MSSSRVLDGRGHGRASQQIPAALTADRHYDLPAEHFLHDPQGGSIERVEQATARFESCSRSYCCTRVHAAMSLCRSIW
jgi:hypothetical protein